MTTIKLLQGSASLRLTAYSELDAAAGIATSLSVWNGYGHATVDLTPAERRQLAAALLDGLPAETAAHS